MEPYQFQEARRAEGVALIVRLERERVADVARLHRANLTGLLSQLGSTAVTAFYVACTRTNLALGLVYLDDDEVRGFVLGSPHPERLRVETLWKNPVGTLLGTVLGVLRRPSAFPSLVKNLRASSREDYNRNSAELIYIAVSSESRGGGIGAELLDAFTREMRDAGVTAYELSVDDDNKDAAAFYERRGFVLCGRYAEFGVMHRRYRLQIS